MASLQQQNGALKAQSAQDCEAVERAAILQTEVEELRGRLELLTEHCHALTSKPTVCAKCLQGVDQHEGPTWTVPYPTQPLAHGVGEEANASANPDPGLLARGDAEGKRGTGVKRAGPEARSKRRRVPIWARFSGFGGARGTRRSVQYQWAFGRRVRRVTGDSAAPTPARAHPALRASSPLWRSDQRGRPQKPVPRPVPPVVHPPQEPRPLPQAPAVPDVPQAPPAGQTVLAQPLEHGLKAPVLSTAASGIGVEEVLRRIPLTIGQKPEAPTRERNVGNSQGEIGGGAAPHAERREEWALHGHHPPIEGGSDAVPVDPHNRAHVPAPRRSRSSLIRTGMLVRPALRPTIAASSLETAFREEAALGPEPVRQVKGPPEDPTAAAANLALRAAERVGDTGVAGAHTVLRGVIGKPAAPRMTVAARVMGADNGAGQQRRETVRVLGSHADVLASLEMLGL